MQHLALTTGEGVMNFDQVLMGLAKSTGIKMLQQHKVTAQNLVKASNSFSDAADILDALNIEDIAFILTVPNYL